MKKLFILAILAMNLLFTGCSSTTKISLEKKPLNSDHYLLMSLLNRPMTADQKMMLAFADQRALYHGATFVNAITIKGEKDHEAANSRATNSYSMLIAQDFNSVRISGPK